MASCDILYIVAGTHHILTLIILSNELSLWLQRYYFKTIMAKSMAQISKSQGQMIVRHSTNSLIFRLDDPGNAGASTKMDCRAVQQLQYNLYVIQTFFFCH